MEDLHAVVAGVGDGERPEEARHEGAISHGHAGRRREVAVARAVEAELCHKLAGGPQHLHAVVAGVGYDESAVEVAAGVDRHGTVELPVAGAARSEQGHIARVDRKACIGAVISVVENRHAIVASVGDV